MERELLDRARDAEIARRRDCFRRLELVAELDGAAVAVVTGDRGTARLLQSHWRVDLAEAKRLVAEAADLVARRSLQGEPLPPRLPCTAAAAVGAGHVAVIRRTMARLERIDGLSVEDNPDPADDPAPPSGPVREVIGRGDDRVVGTPCPGAGPARTRE